MGAVPVPVPCGGRVTLARFRSSNHPQQVAVHGARPDIDDRATTPEVFDPLNDRFRFTVDAAASAENAKLPRYWSVEDDGLAQAWWGERVWCNPPYSNIRPWVEKAWAETGVQPFAATLVVMLLPANRTEQKWWHDLVEPYRDRGLGLSVEFIPGRLRFLKPGDTVVPPNSRPPFGCCLLVWESVR